MIVRIFTIIVSCLFAFIISYAQEGKPKTLNKTQRNFIYRPNKVTINNQKSTTINNINNTKLTGKIYLTNFNNFVNYKDTSNIDCPTIDFLEFSNPDSVEMDNVDFSVNVKLPFDTAYFTITNPVYPNYGKSASVFDIHSPVRDLYRTCSTDKRTVTFKAGYLAAKTKITLFIIGKYRNGENTNTVLTGVSKLF